VVGGTEGVVEVAAAVAAAVVGQDPFDGDAMAGEEDGGSSPELGGGDTELVGEDFAVGDAGVGVDGGVHEGVTDLGAAVAAPFGGAAVDPPAATAWDPADLLDVDVDELAGPGRLDASHRLAGDAVEMVEAIHAVSGQDAVDGRGVHPDDAGDPGWAEPAAGAEGNDPPLSGRLGPSWRRGRARRAVLESGDAFSLVAAPPHVGAVAGDADRRGRVRDWPAAFDSLTQQQSAARGQAGVTVHPEPPLRVGVLADPHSPRRLHLRVDPVSKVHGHYN
jgi:hypothetical protein